MDKVVLKRNLKGLVFIILVAIVSVLAMHFFYSPHAPVSDTINVPVDAPAPLVDNPEATHPAK